MKIVELLLRGALSDAIRWHYYDDQRGHDSADPSRSGINSEILASMESCFDDEAVNRLRHEGLAWAKQEMSESGWMSWSEAKSRLKAD